LLAEIEDIIKLSIVKPEFILTKVKSPLNVELVKLQSTHFKLVEILVDSIKKNCMAETVALFTVSD
jgi:hypothetical protein